MAQHWPSFSRYSDCVKKEKVGLAFQEKMKILWKYVYNRIFMYFNMFLFFWKDSPRPQAKSVLRTKTLDWLCNRRNKDSCSLDGKYLQTCIIYKADINFQKISATTTQTRQFYSKMDSELIPQRKDVDHECLTFI